MTLRRTLYSPSVHYFGASSDPVIRDCLNWFLPILDLQTDHLKSEELLKELKLSLFAIFLFRIFVSQLENLKLAKGVD